MRTVSAPSDDGKRACPSLDYFRELAASRLDAGADRNAVLTELLDVNKKAGGHVPDADLFDLILNRPEDCPGAAKIEQPTSHNTPPCRGVNQDSQDLQDSQRPSGTSKEFQRDSGSCPAKKTSRATDLETSDRTGAQQSPPPKNEEQAWRQAFWKDSTEGRTPSLPLNVWVGIALSEHRNRERWEPGLEGWESPLFWFLRHIRHHPDLAKLTARGAFNKIAKLVRQSWHAIPEGRCDAGDWNYWFEMDREEVEVEFLDCWDKIKWLPGSDPLENALRLAQANPLRTLKEKKAKRSAGYDLFVSVAGWLQVAVGDRPIVLPVKEVGELLGVSTKIISTYRRWAKEDGFLQEIREHLRPERGKAGEATEFRFNVGRFPILRERLGLDEDQE